MPAFPVLQILFSDGFLQSAAMHCSGAEAPCMWHLHLDVWVSALCKEYMSVSVKALVHIAGLQRMENVNAGDCISSCVRHVASADGGCL